MNIDEYERSGRRKYEQLASVVASILEATVDSIPGLKKQQVQYRAKDLASLRKKLEASGALGSDDITKKAKDLAGCRVIFYTNSDVRTFEHDRALWDNFEVDWDRTKFHYPLEEYDEAFVSKNYVVSLKEPRASLPEYSHLKGLWCEVQVQTTLDHAWSEMSHDIIYKPPAEEFGTQALASIKERLRKVMKDHLQPAGFDFQKISNDMSRLEKGRELYNANLLEAIKVSGDNNEIYRLIGEYKDYVFPFIDDINREAELIRDTLRVAVAKTKGTPETPFLVGKASFAGHSGEDIFRKALSLAEDISFVGQSPIEDTFNLLIDWYDESVLEEQRTQILKALENLAEYNLHIWKQAGASVQMRLVECLEGRLSKVTSFDIPTVAIAKEMLNTELSGTTSSAYEVTIHQGSVVFYDVLEQVRDKCIQILIEMYNRCKDAKQYSSVINALTACTRLPHRGKVTPELVKMVLEDSVDFIKFCTAEIKTFPLDVLESVEHRVFYLKRTWAEKIKTDWFTSEVAAVRDDLIKLIDDFKNLVNSNDDFVTFKTLVGFEGISLKDWERGEIDLDERRAETNSEIEKFVAQINDETLDNWKSRIRACCAIKSDDLATFINFSEFLCCLGKAKPDVAIDILNTEGSEVLAFSYNLLKGLAASSRPEEALKIVKSWLDSGKNLFQISRFFTTLTDYDGPLFEKGLKQAIEENNVTAVAIMVDVGIKFVSTNPEAMKQLLLPAIRYLNNVDSRYWVNRSWGNLRSGEIVQKFSQEEIEELLDGMIKIFKLSYPEEWVLAGFSLHWPDKVFEFFIKRLEYDDAKSPDDYEAVPFSFHQLNNNASINHDLIIKIARSRFPVEGAFFQFRTARLVHNFFPDLNLLEPVLMMLISTREEQDLRIAAEILTIYDGHPEVFRLAKEIAAIAEPGSNAWKKLEFALDATGVVSGHFGFVEAYKGKKDLLNSWLEDDRPNVKKFAEDYIRNLDKQISAEQRRSMEDKHLRERHYESKLFGEEELN